MTELNAKLISETLLKLAVSGDYAGVNYYRDSLIGNNALTADQAKFINISADDAYALACRMSTIK